MQFAEQIQLECMRAFLSAVVVGVGAFLAWGVGKRISEYWDTRRKKRELDLSTLNEFYRQYGEFFAVWKLWNSQKIRRDKAFQPDAAWKLLERASSIEAAIESILVKIVTERKLSEEDIDVFGLLRQAFKSLRKRIDENEQLDWSHSEHEEYIALKRLACHLTTFILHGHIDTAPTKEEAATALSRITANHPHEERWMEFGFKEWNKS